MHALFSANRHTVDPEYRIGSFIEKQSLACGPLVHRDYNSFQDDNLVYDLDPFFDRGETSPAPPQLYSSVGREEDAGEDAN